MKAIIQHLDSGIPSKNYKQFDNFIKYLQQKYPLRKDVFIKFLGKRKGDMTTASHNINHNITILSKNRMNRDILRSLAHEWIHEYQTSIQKRKPGPDIGGKNENEANSLSGKIIKQFEKDFPKMEDFLYENYL